MPVKERPRERLLEVGEENLSDVELLSILLGTGTKNLNVKELSINILNQIKALSKLQKINKEHLLQIKGIGKAKTATILAALELGKRIYIVKEQLPKIKLNNLNNAEENLNHKDNLKLYNNLFQLEKMKYKSYYVRKNGLWNKLAKEQKVELITKYIDSIEIEKNKEEIIIKKININKKEIQNIGYMFRNDCFDMVVNINDRDVILSNEKTKEDITKYIETLSKFYKIAPITIEKNKLDIDNLSNNSLLQIIPNKKENKFDKDKYTLLQIGA